MIANKHITKIVAVIMAIAVCLCLCAIICSEELEKVLGSSGIEMEYESKIFDTDEIININIIMDEDEWDSMLSNATAEQYYSCDVEINGETLYNIGIRPKGNTSLSSISSDPDNDRYSLKLEFDQYESQQSYYGLDKLILNNNFADATNMKEALIYDMFQYIGAEASLYNYAQISVNGEYWGVYLALEAVEESFMLRNYGANYGELYKPDSMDFGNMGGAGSMMGGSGSDLNYTDDDLDSYSTIWNCEVTDTTTKDHKRVVKALRNISEGTDLDTYMNVDNLLKYVAVHVFSVNTDSLSGMMTHNYYLYESKGMLNIFPWDYNLSLGGMGGMGNFGGKGNSNNDKDKGNTVDATSMVNDAIDNAFSGTKFFDTLLEDEEYHAKYYEYLQQLVDEYLLGEGFEKFYNRTRMQIDELVKNDPNALYTYEEYEEALEVLCEVVNLRGRSIDGQLDGSIPSTSKEQTGSDTLIDASHIDLLAMGTMNMGGGSSFKDGTYKEESEEEKEMSQFGGEMPEGFDPSQFGGEMPEGFDPSQFGGKMPGKGEFSQFTEVGGKGNMPNMNLGVKPFGSSIQNIVIYGICFLILVGGLLFATLFKRKKYRR